MLSPYYHSDPSRDWPADQIVHGLIAGGMHAKRDEDRIEVQVEIDRLMPISSRLVCWLQHACFARCDILISFTKERFLRNVSIDVLRTFSSEYETYVGGTIDAVLRSVGCVELLTNEDEIAIARQIGGLDATIERAIALLQDSTSAVDRLHTPLDFATLGQSLDRENMARTRLDLLLSKCCEP